MSRRRTNGTETWARLRDWVHGQPAAERLAAHVLRVEGFTSVDPSHPLGGPDGLKDVKCLRQSTPFVGAAYFPRGQQVFGRIKRKFDQDIKGVDKNKVSGLAFVTNQEITLGQRQELTASAGEKHLELFHLERVATILDYPQCYGIRLEFLDIDMTKEEQLAFFAFRDSALERLQATLDKLLSPSTDMPGHTMRDNIPLSELKEFNEVLSSIIEPAGIFGGSVDRIRGLHVPLRELREFEEILGRLTEGGTFFDDSSPVSRLAGSLRQLREVEEIVDRLIEPEGTFITDKIGRLHVPLRELQEFEEALNRVEDTVDRIVKKLRIKRGLEVRE